MKIALGMRDFSPAKGGAERSMAELMGFLAKEGHEVHIYAHRFGKLEDPFILHRVPAIPFPKSLKVLSFAWWCQHKIKQEAFDVVMGVGNTFSADLLQPRGGVHWSWFWKSLGAYKKPLLWGIKFLGRILSLKQWAQGMVENAPYKRAKKIVAISEMIKQDILHYYRIPEERIAVIYTGIDIERFHPGNMRFREEIRKRHGIPSDSFVLLFSSHNFRLKGLKYLIRALPLVKKEKKKIKLLILGRDKKNLYSRLARKLGCEGEVLFAGGVNEPEKYYAAADILVHPTFYDACSRVVLEALASGLPVITTRYDGAGWLISGGQEGFVLDDPSDIKTLAEKIIFLSAPTLLKRASHAARQLAQKNPLQRSYHELLSVLKEVRV